MPRAKSMCGKRAFSSPSEDGVRRSSRLKVANADEDVEEEDAAAVSSDADVEDDEDGSYEVDIEDAAVDEAADEADHEDGDKDGAEVQEMTIGSRFSSHRITKLALEMSQEKKDLLAEHNLSFLLDIKKISVQPHFMMWLMRHTRTESSEIVVGDKRIPITKHMADKVVGLPEGSQKVVTTPGSDPRLRKIAEKLIKQYHPTSSLLPVCTLIDKLEKDLRDEEWYIRSLFLLFVNCVLFPRTDNNIKLDYLHSLIDIQKILSYDWADAMLKYLFHEVQHFQSLGTYGVGENVKKHFIKGCLPLLAIIYMDFHVFEVRNHCLNYNCPRICNVDTADLELFIADDIADDNEYGASQLRDISETPYAGLASTSASGAPVDPSMSGSQAGRTKAHVRSHGRRGVSKPAPKLRGRPPRPPPVASRGPIRGSVPSAMGLDPQSKAIVDRLESKWQNQFKIATQSYVNSVNLMHNEVVSELIRELAAAKKSGDSATTSADVSRDDHDDGGDAGDKNDHEQNRTDNLVHDLNQRSSANLDSGASDPGPACGIHDGNKEQDSDIVQSACTVDAPHKNADAPMVPCGKNDSHDFNISSDQHISMNVVDSGNPLDTSSKVVPTAKVGVPEDLVQSAAVLDPTFITVLGAAIDTDRCKDLDWCFLALDWLVYHIKIFKSQVSLGVPCKIGGCLLVIVSYAVLDSVSPGVFGRLPLKHISCTPFSDLEKRRINVPHVQMCKSVEKNVKIRFHAPDDSSASATDKYFELCEKMLHAVLPVIESYASSVVSGSRSKTKFNIDHLDVPYYVASSEQFSDSQCEESSCDSLHYFEDAEVVSFTSESVSANSSKSKRDEYSKLVKSARPMKVPEMGDASVSSLDGFQSCLATKKPQDFPAFELPTSFLTYQDVVNSIVAGSSRSHEPQVSPHKSINLPDLAALQTEDSARKETTVEDKVHIPVPTNKRVVIGMSLNERCLGRRIPQQLVSPEPIPSFDIFADVDAIDESTRSKNVDECSETEATFWRDVLPIITKAEADYSLLSPSNVTNISGQTSNLVASAQDKAVFLSPNQPQGNEKNNSGQQSWKKVVQNIALRPPSNANTSFVSSIDLLSPNHGSRHDRNFDQQLVFSNEHQKIMFEELTQAPNLDNKKRDIVFKSGRFWITENIFLFSMRITGWMHVLVMDAFGKMIMIDQYERSNLGMKPRHEVVKFIILSDIGGLLTDPAMFHNDYRYLLTEGHLNVRLLNCGLLKSYPRAGTFNIREFKVYYPVMPKASSVNDSGVFVVRFLQTYNGINIHQFSDVDVKALREILLFQLVCFPYSEKHLPIAKPFVDAYFAEILQEDKKETTTAIC
ncbi:hypothetical protein ACP70R_002594 [Stipagrostis hirtigluma subsp. patula]